MGLSMSRRRGDRRKAYAACANRNGAMSQSLEPQIAPMGRDEIHIKARPRHS